MTTASMSQNSYRSNQSTALLYEPNTMDDSPLMLDPASDEDLYGFVGDNPINRVDPTGLQAATTQAGVVEVKIYISTLGNTASVLNSQKDAQIKTNPIGFLQPPADQNTPININDLSDEITAELKRVQALAGDKKVVVTEVHVLGHSEAGVSAVRVGTGVMYYNLPNPPTPQQVKAGATIDLGQKEVQAAIQAIDATLGGKAKWIFDGCEGTNPEHKALLIQFANIIGRPVTAYVEETDHDPNSGNVVKAGTTQPATPATILPAGQ